MINVSKPIVGPEEADAVLRVLASGVLANGPESRAFENEWAAYLGASEAVLVSNGTTALEGALASLRADNPYQDEVLVPGMSFNATSSAVLAAGLRPVFVDINGYSNNIDPEKAKKARNRRTLGIIAVDLYGLMADYEALNELDLPIIEDAAQAHGAEYRGYKPGSDALFRRYPNLYATTFSFYATKNITTGGEGGAVVSSDWEVMRTIRLLREHGAETRYVHEEPGHNWRVTEMQAAVGRVQLRHLDEWQAIRDENAEVYSKYQDDGGLHLYYDKPYYRDNYKHGWHQYVVRIMPEYRPLIMEYAERNGVKLDIHYPTTDPEQPMYGYQEHYTPSATNLAREALSVPVGPHIGPEERATIVRVLNEAVPYAEETYRDRS